MRECLILLRTRVCVEAPFVTIGQIPPLLFFLFFAITPIPGRVGRGIPNSYTDETDQ